MGLFGGKNSFINKPLGTGKNSVNAAGRRTIGSPLWDMGASYASIQTGSIKPSIESAKSSAKGALNTVGLGPEDPQFSGGNQMSKQDIMNAMKFGEQKGEQISGATSGEVGAGRKEVRTQLQDILQGNSAGANRMQQSQNEQDKQMKARQAMSGGGGQMSEGMRQAQDRAQVRDLAEFRSNEQRQALSDLSKEWRGAGSDIMKSSGQYGSIMIGAQPPAVPQQQQGLLSGLLGGLF